MGTRKKIKVGVIFGGRSGEHEVSLVSAASVMRALDKKKYELVLIGITKEGKWIVEEDSLEVLREGKGISKKNEALLILDPNKDGFLRVGEKVIKIDVAFPVLHGPYGEDGTIQGLFETVDIPYVGAGVLASSVGMDKVVQKQLFEQTGLSVVKYLSFTKPVSGKCSISNILRQPKGVRKMLRDKTTLEKCSLISILRRLIIPRIEKNLGYPCFVKPVNLGSSVGISNAYDRKKLLEGMRVAWRYDRKIIIEKAVSNAREIECSVLGNKEPMVSVPGEIIPSGEFYDYNAKYVDGASKTVIPAKLPPKVTKTIQDIALKAYKAIDCSGMARADFLVDKKTHKIYLNELNTIPGFTSISMYPKLWEATGLKYSKLLDMLIELAFERFKEKNKLVTSYTAKKKWYKGN